MNKTKLAVLVVACSLGLSACGATQPDRALGGAAIGATAGAAAGAFSGPVGVGVGIAVGALVGGATGYLTQQRDLDLGPPIWR